MSDDTTTWLKKNPAINPLRRSLKSSLRCQFPIPDMDNSIISNPDKTKNQDVFIPRMLQRPKGQTKTMKSQQFKVPEMVVPKSKKKEQISSGSRAKCTKSPLVGRKSFLPVPKTKSQIPEKKPSKENFPRPSCAPGSSGRKTMAKREVIQKIFQELSEMKGKEVPSVLKMTSASNSVLRGILKKKRNSLRRASQISVTKPKARKVLFDGYNNSESLEEKENVENQMHQNFEALDEPTVYLNFPKGHHQQMESTPTNVLENSSWTLTECETNVTDVNNFTELYKVWNNYKENLNKLESMRNSLENSIDSFLQPFQSFLHAYTIYRKDSEEIYSNLTGLEKKLEENFKMAMADDDDEHGNDSKSPMVIRRGSSRKKSVEKIKLSDKSKVIKRNSGKNPVKNLTKELLNESYNSVYKKTFF